MSGHGPNYDVGRKARRSFVATAAVVAILILGQATGNVLTLVGIHEIQKTQQSGSPTSQRLIEILAGISEQQDDIARAVDNSNSAARDAAFIARQLRSCLTPGEKCFRRSQQHQQTIIQQIQIGQACSTGFAYIDDSDERIAATLHCVAQWYREHS